MQRIYVCQFEIINQRKKEKDFQDVLLITAAQAGSLSLTRRIRSSGVRCQDQQGDACLCQPIGLMTAVLINSLISK